MSIATTLEVKLPQFGMGMTDGTIIAWHKQPGDHVEKGEPLCDVEAAKTTVEYESPESGRLERILVQVDENVPVNTVLCELIVGAGAAAPDGEAETAPAVAPIAEEADIPLAATAAAPKATPLARRSAESQGIDLADVNGTGARGRILRKDLPERAAPPPQVQIEPRARKAARDLGVDLATVQGSGPGGRIVAEDVAAAAAKTKAASATPAPPAAPADAPAEAQGFTEIPHSMMRRTIARRLTESKQQVPHFYVKASCRIDALLQLRKEINGVDAAKVSVNDLVVRAVALALIEIPDANVAWGEKALRKYESVDVAVAVATPRGLVTPIVRAVETKTIRRISAEVKDLAERARQGKLKPEEYQGGNSSVSNLGMFGVEEFSAILNPPQSSIFAVGAGEERVIVVDGKPAVATMMNVVISVDHRAVDGAVAAQLLASFKRLIETPSKILA
ncbi:MAG: 2-oxo acid dehydrogenase subunit E2 [Alphaproteobacteria bacterium]|nr:2-oxo acid dehydrogenase subunit E2 [Alphaproteobacteria bacterium]